MPKKKKKTAQNYKPTKKILEEIRKPKPPKPKEYPELPKTPRPKAPEKPRSLIGDTMKKAQTARERTEAVIRRTANPKRKSVKGNY
jgi:hypothetical protein